MLATVFAVTGKTLSHDGKTFAIKAAGIRDDQPYAKVEPHDEAIVQTIDKYISRCMPLPFSLDEVQKELSDSNPGAFCCIERISHFFTKGD